MSELFFTLDSESPPLLSKKRQLEREVDHLADCVTDADKNAAEANIRALCAEIASMEREAMGARP